MRQQNALSMCLLCDYLGTTYWIDFESFSSVDGGVSAPGTCANRRSSDYVGLSFAEMWDYPLNPANLESVGGTSTAQYQLHHSSDAGNSEGISWSQANDYCSATYGTTLATIRDDADADAVFALQQDLGTEHVWVGMQSMDSVEAGRWDWVSGYQWLSTVQRVSAKNMMRLCSLRVTLSPRIQKLTCFLSCGQRRRMCVAQLVVPRRTAWRRHLQCHLHALQHRAAAIELGPL